MSKFKKAREEEGMQEQSKLDRFTSTLESLSRFCNAILAMATVAGLIIMSFSLLKSFQAPDPFRHCCASCKKEFVCKAKGKRPKKQKIHSFKRRTVQIGSFPLEITKAENNDDLCCGTELGNGQRARFCNFQCYLQFQKRTTKE